MSGNIYGRQRSSGHAWLFSAGVKLCHRWRHNDHAQKSWTTTSVYPMSSMFAAQERCDDIVRLYGHRCALVPPTHARMTQLAAQATMHQQAGANLAFVSAES